MIDAPVRDTRGASRECRSRYNAPSDGPNMVPLKDFEALVRDATALDAVVKAASRVALPTRARSKEAALFPSFRPHGGCGYGVPRLPNACEPMRQCPP